MKIAKIQLSNGKVAKFEVPDDYTPEQAQAEAESMMFGKQAEEPYKPENVAKNFETTLQFGPLDTGIGLGGASNFVAGMGKGFSDTGKGIKQLFNIGDQDQLNRDIAESRQLDKPLTDTFSGAAGNITGSIASTAPAMFIPGANTLVGAGLIGAGTGALMPSLSDSETLGNMAAGGVGGAAGVFAGRAIPSAYSAFVSPFFEGGRQKIAGNVLRDFAGDDTAAALAKLQNPEVYVPGSMPSLAEVLMTPKSATLHKSVERLPEAKDIIKAAEYRNNAARVDAINSIAQDKAAVLAAQDARRAATKGDYDLVHNQFIQSNPDLERILQTPSGQSAVSTARTLAGNEYRQSGEPAPSMGGLGSTVQATKDTAEKAADHWTKQPINYDKDNMLTAIRKMGGISKEMAQNTYGNRMWEDGLGHGLFRNGGGQSLDDLAARLSEHGYLPEGAGPYEVVEALYGGNGGGMFSNAKQSFDDVFRPEETANDALLSQLKRVADNLEAKNKPKAAIDTPEKSPYDVAYYGRDLHNIQRSLKDMATNPNADPVMKYSISSLLDDYTKQLENNVPGLLDVNKKYADLSRPINQMEVGQKLKEKLIPALVDGEMPTRQRAEMFANAIRNEDATIKSATGQRNKTLADLFEPEQYDLIQGIRKDLSRRGSMYDQVRTGGSDTASNLIADNMLRSIIGPIGMPDSWLSRAAGSAVMNALPRRAVDLAVPSVERKVQGLLAEALTDPRFAAQLIKKATPKSKISGRMSLQEFLYPALGSAGAYGAMAAN